MPADLILYTLAILALIAGIATLILAWQKRGQLGPLVLPAWSLVGISLFLWSRTTGAEKGVALGLVALMLMAGVVLGRQALIANPKTTPKEPVRRVSVPIPHTPFLRSIAAALLIGPIAGLGALSLSVAIFSAIEASAGEPTANLVLCYFLFPLGWAAFALYAALDGKLWRRASVLAASCMLPLSLTLAIS